MRRISRFGKTLAIAGFGCGGAAWLWAAFGDDRDAAIAAFVLSYIVVTTGITSSIIFGESKSVDGVSLIGQKIAAVGFAIMSIPTAIGAFFFGRRDDELSLFFGLGAAVFVTGLGIFFHAVAQRKRDGS